MIDELQELQCANCDKLVYHMTQCQQIDELKQQLSSYNELLKNESNEKINEFFAKNKVLREFQMIDEEDKLLYKGKVARLVNYGSPILTTQLFFSGLFKSLDDKELLAIFSVLDDTKRPGGGAKMLES